MTKNAISKADAIWSYVGLASRLGINFMLIPILLAYLNEDEIGMWYVFMSFTALVTLLQLGFAPALGRNIAYCYAGARAVARNGVVGGSDGASVDWKMFANLILLSIRFYRVIAIVAVVLLATVGTLYIYYISQGSEISAFLPWTVFCVSVFLNLYFTYFESLLRGICEIASVNKALTISVVVQFFACSIFLVAGFGLLAPVIAYALQGVLFRALCNKYFWSSSKLKGNLSVGECKDYRDKTYQKELYRDLSPNAYKDGLVSLATFLLSQSNTLICSAFLSLSEAGIYSLTVQIVNAVANFSSVMVNAYHPAIQVAYAQGDKESMRGLVGRSTVAFVAMYVLGSIGVYIVVIPLLNLFKPSYVLDAPYLLLVFLYYFLYKNQSNFAAIISDTNIIPYTGSFVVSSIVGVLVTVVFVSIGMGMWGLILGHLLVQAMYNNWAWVRYVCRMLGIGLIPLLKQGASFWVSKLCWGKEKR